MRVNQLLSDTREVTIDAPQGSLGTVEVLGFISDLPDTLNSGLVVLTSRSHLINSAKSNMVLAKKGELKCEEITS